MFLSFFLSFLLLYFIFCLSFLSFLFFSVFLFFGLFLIFFSFCSLQQKFHRRLRTTPGGVGRESWTLRWGHGQTPNAEDTGRKQLELEGGVGWGGASRFSVVTGPTEGWVEGLGLPGAPACGFCWNLHKRIKRVWGYGCKIQSEARAGAHEGCIHGSPTVQKDEKTQQSKGDTLMGRDVGTPLGLGDVLGACCSGEHTGPS